MELDRYTHEPLISIGTAAKFLGISVSSVRQYESEGLLLLQRSGSRRRLLTIADLERVRCIKECLNQRHSGVNGIRKDLAAIPCWDVLGCTIEERTDCPSFMDLTAPCWVVKGKLRRTNNLNCAECCVYRFACDWLVGMVESMQKAAVN